MRLSLSFFFSPSDPLHSPKPSRAQPSLSPAGHALDPGHLISRAAAAQAQQQRVWERERAARAEAAAAAASAALPPFDPAELREANAAIGAIAIPGGWVGREAACAKEEGGPFVPAVCPLPATCCPRPAVWECSPLGWVGPCYPLAVLPEPSGLPMSA